LEEKLINVVKTVRLEMGPQYFDEVIFQQVIAWSSEPSQQSSRQGVHHKAASRYEGQGHLTTTQEPIQDVPRKRDMLPESLNRREQDIMQCC